MKTFSSKGLRRDDRTRGLVLIQVLAVLAVVLALAGFVLPPTLTDLEARAADGTEERLDRLARAIEAFAEDTLRLPDDLADLLAPTCVFAGWCGPYLLDPFDASAPGIVRRYDLDGFGTPIEWTHPGATLGRLRSAGTDRLWDTADDVVREIDLRPAMRGETMHRVHAINGAIQRFNQNRTSPSQVLPTAWSPARAELLSEDFLDLDAAWIADSWGAPFVRDPIVQYASGAPPGSLQKVTSSNF